MRYISGRDRKKFEREISEGQNVYNSSRKVPISYRAGQKIFWVRTHIICGFVFNDDIYTIQAVIFSEFAI